MELKDPINFVLWAAFVATSIAGAYTMVDQRIDTQAPLFNPAAIAADESDEVARSNGFISEANAAPKRLQLVQTKQIYRISQKEYDCLIKNTYHEAGIENDVGKIAVVQVVFNRLHKRAKWSNVCKVITHRKAFSWTTMTHKVNEVYDPEMLNTVKMSVDAFLNGVRVKGLTSKTMYYHALYIQPPSWAKGMKVVKYIGRHVFLEEG